MYVCMYVWKNTKHVLSRKTAKQKDFDQADTYIHTCIHTYMHTYMHTYIRNGTKPMATEKKKVNEFNPYVCVNVCVCVYAYSYM